MPNAMTVADLSSNGRKCGKEPYNNEVPLAHFGRLLNIHSGKLLWVEERANVSPTP